MIYPDAAANRVSFAKKIGSLVLATDCSGFFDGGREVSRYPIIALLARSASGVVAFHNRRQLLPSVSVTYEIERIVAFGRCFSLKILVYSHRAQLFIPCFNDLIVDPFAVSC